MNKNCWVVQKAGQKDHGEPGRVPPYVQDDDRDLGKGRTGEPGDPGTAYQGQHFIDQPDIFVKQHPEDQTHGDGGTDIGQKGSGLEKGACPAAAQITAVQQAGDQKSAADDQDQAGDPVNDGIA